MSISKCLRTLFFFSFVLCGEALFAQAAPAAGVPASESDRAERIMKAFSRAHPSRIGPAQIRDGDWAFQVNGKWFYYAEGRLLPEELRRRFNEYSPQGLYNYSTEWPVWREPSEEESERFRNITRQRAEAARNPNPIRRSQHLFNAIWRAETRDQSYERLSRVRFLGHSILIHEDLVEVLSAVEGKIQAEARTRADVRQWLNEIGSVETWNWRNVAESANRSFHSYGIAIDILPKSLRGLETYWLWASRNNAEWWKVPYSRRYHPPETVVKIFESYGFIWGGKWAVYDTMHFEYRPEIFVYNNLPIK